MITKQDYMEDNLTTIEYAGHVWEFGHFGAKNNRWISAFGFRQDGTIIRVTSKYEAELIAELFNRAVAK